MNTLLNHIREVSYKNANSIIRQLSGIVDYFSSEFEKTAFMACHDMQPEMVCDDNRVSYGDWQTPLPLAEEVCDIHLSEYGSPDIVIEPTCGLGAFVSAALTKFKDVKEIHAIEINSQYTGELKLKLLLNALRAPMQKYPDIYVYNADFFEFDFQPLMEKSKENGWNVAVIGNPPWVTNSRQGKNNSLNVPSKSNTYGLKGIDAITGKSNFDISEYITLHLLRLSQFNKGGISFLLKNSVIRNILVKQHSEKIRFGYIQQRLIDASKEFDVAVDASCFMAQLNCDPSFTCRLVDFYTQSYIRDYGWVNDSFVSDIKLYRGVSKYDNRSTYVWRSGIKHDCASILELTYSDGIYINGLGESVEIEDDIIYPLLKSSDINNYQQNRFRKYVIVPQRKIGDDTSQLRYSHPRAYSYLKKHENVFSNRKSSIYRGKDTFSIFGIGDYSFKPYKIVVSSLYKDIKFVLVSPYDKKPVMVDDTCYQLDFDRKEDARNILDALRSSEIQSLLQSLVFKDAKRVVTKSLLMRLNLAQLCRDRGVKIHSQSFIDSGYIQLSLFDGLV